MSVHVSSSSLSLPRSFPFPSSLKCDSPTPQYFVFFVGEHFLKVSGVLAVVSLGVFLSAYGKIRISPEVEEFMHEFWEVLSCEFSRVVFCQTSILSNESLSRRTTAPLTLLNSSATP